MKDVTPQKKKITITIEDDGDSVKVVADPSFAELMEGMMEKEPTAAICYALGALNKIRDMSKQADKGLAEIQMPLLKSVEPLEN